MRKFLYAIFLLLWIPAAYAAELPEFPFVFADGEATVEVPPDIAAVSFSVEQFDENELEALQVVQNRSAELIEFFMSLKIDEEDINIFSRYGYGNFSVENRMSPSDPPGIE